MRPLDQDLASLVARIQERPASTNGVPDPSPRAQGAGARERPSTTRGKKPWVAAGIPEPYDDHFAAVIDGMLDGNVVPLLGPGVRQGLPASRKSLLPSSSSSIASSFGFASRAQQIAVTLGERRLYNSIKRLVEAQSAPTNVHHFLARLPGRLRQMGLPARHS